MAEINWSILGDLGKTYKEARLQANRERTLAELGQGGGPIDYNDAARRLLSAGDTQGAMLLSNLGNNQRDFQFRKDESGRAQSNADRTFKFQQDQATEAARGYELREVDGPNGKELVRIHKQDGRAERVNVGGQDTQQPNNPYVTGGPMNEAQSKDSLYATRMMRAEGALRHGNIAASQAFEGAKGGGYVQNGDRVPGPGGHSVEMAGTDWTERRKAYITDKTGFNVNSPEYQKFDQARRDFINATLRRESGAVISPDEFDNANKQYFPMPGNSPDLLKQKRENREEAIRGIAAGAGRGYRPDYKFDQNSNIVPNPAAKRTAPASGQAPQQQAIPPKLGEVRDGYRYKGGPPGDETSWVQIK